MKRENSRIERFIPLLIILLVLAAVLAVTPTLARYVRRTDEKPNDFGSVGSDNPPVNDDFTVTVEDKGYPVYVRASILINWQKDGVNSFSKPLETADYELEYNTEYWTRNADGYYYYTYMEDGEYYPLSVKSGATTEKLILSFVDMETEPPFEGYELNLEVMVQTVQALGSTDDDSQSAWQNAWGIEKITPWKD